MHKYDYIVDKSQKLSDFLFSLGLKPSEVATLYKNRDVKVNGIRKNVNEEIFSGQTITLFLKFELAKKYEVVYEDENIYIVNKFEGIEVEGSSGVANSLNAIAVHRLDRNTKGLLILAKNKDAEEELLLALKNGDITKKYLCEVVGRTNFNNEILKGYLFKDAKKSEVYVYSEPKPKTVKIETKFKTLKSSNLTSIVECELITGKTHQIRAHLSFLGHAILGDGKYGKNEVNKKFKETTQKLHCYYLKFNNMQRILIYLNNKEFVLYPSWYKIKN